MRTLFIKALKKLLSKRKISQKIFGKEKRSYLGVRPGMTERSGKLCTDDLPVLSSLGWTFFPLLYEISYFNLEVPLYCTEPSP